MAEEKTGEYIMGYSHALFIILKTYVETLTPEDRDYFKESVEANRKKIMGLFYDSPIISLSEESKAGFDRVFDGIFNEDISSPLNPLED